MASTAIVRPASAASSGTADKPRPRRDEVRAQLDHLLASPLFSQSKHYPGLLRYVVNETLEGRVVQLKERSLGVAVFNRAPDYDTNADPVVRTSACEIRKRLARYYQEPGHEGEVRIELPPGSYVPDFHLPMEAAPAPVVEMASPLPVEVPATAASETPVRGRRVGWVWVALGSAAVFGAAGWALTTREWHPEPTAVQRFWGPLWNSPDPLMLALGMPSEGVPPVHPTKSGPTFRDVMIMDRVAFSDALTMARLTDFSRDFGKRKLDIRRAPSVTLSELRNGPAILVGAFNNPWTMRLNSGLRFTYQWSPASHIGRIIDRDHPENRGWIHDPSVPYAGITHDYSIVSRFVDSLTEKTVLVVGGMGRDGTIAASEFVTGPHYLDMLAARAPKNWDKNNLQVIIETEVVDGKTGPPHIVETHFW